MSDVRTNLMPNPRASTPAYWPPRWYGGGAGAGTVTTVTGATDGPLDITTYQRKTWTVSGNGDGATGFALMFTPTATGGARYLPVTPGQTVTFSAYMRATSAVPRRLYAPLQSQDATGAPLETRVGAVVMSDGTWQRVSTTITVEDDGTKYLMPIADIQSGASPWQVGDTLDATGALIEEGGTLEALFDGDTPNTKEVAYAWTGTTHASTSTATVIPQLEVEATVLPRVVPVVQVAINNLPVGAEWRIVGQCQGHTWPVPAGQGVATGEQVVLIDPRAPLNMPVTYRLQVAGRRMVESNAVVVPLAGADVVLSTLDGSWTFVPEFLTAGEFPRAVAPLSVQYAVPGRERGPVRWGPASLAPTTWTLHCSEARSDELMELLRIGMPLVYRLATPVRDLLPVEFILVTAVDSVSYPGAGAWRTWTLEFTYIDDPEPSSTIVASTWDDHDAAYAGATWDDWDAEWIDTNWNGWDRVDWTQRT